MGLDAVELIMEVEERFGVRLPDIEMYYVRTLSDFYSVLLERSGERKRSDCPARKAFCRFRAALGRVLAIALVTEDLFSAFAAGLLALLPGVLLGYIVGVFWVSTLHKPLHTAGGVARAIVALNPGEFRAAVEVPHDGDPTWKKLCDTVAEHFRVPRESLSPDTRFLEDLGC